LRGLGTPPDRIVAVGSPELTLDREGLGNELRARLNVTGEDLLVVLATAPYPNNGNLKLAKVFCDAVSRMKGYRGVVRLHPSEDLREYRKVMEDYPQVSFFSNEEISQDETLAALDVAVVHSSGFGTDVLWSRKVCVVLDVLDDYPLGHGLWMVQDAHAPRARDGKELVETLRMIKEKPGYVMDLKDRASVFSRRMYAARGEEACRNIAGVVRDVAGLE